MKKLIGLILPLAMLLLSAPEAFAQSGTQRTGKVLDANGEAVIGASVLVRGTSTGTVTDADGKFSIDVADGKLLIISSIGYQDVEIKVDQRADYQVVMEEDVDYLEETVVIGYGTVKKKDLTGAVGSIAPASFKAQPVQNVSEMIRGNAPGVTVKENGDGMTKIRIRGANSLNGDNEPLYIVDGVPMGTYSPSDVESIEILKDASATAIYGSRGANGVVVVTTKRGKTGGPHVEVSANVSAAMYPKYYDLLSGPEFKTFYKEYFGKTLTGTGDTDWQRSITQTGVRQNYTANVSGGTDKVKYHVGGTVLSNTGLIKNSDDQSYRVRSNVDFKIGRKVSGKIDVSAQRDKKHWGAATGKSPMLTALVWNPAAPLYDENGNMTVSDPDGITGFVSPYYSTMNGNNNRYTTNITVNTFLAWDIIDGLQLSVQPSFNTTFKEERNFNGKGVTESTASDSKAIRTTRSIDTWNVTTLLNYNKTFGQNHNFGAMIGNELWGTTDNFYSATATGVKYEQLEWNKLELAKIKDIKSTYNAAQLASFFARVNYNYASKYYVTVTFRADGSSKFAPGNKFSYFPSAALGWVISNEEFMKNQNALTFLKLRLSYGVTGNQAIKSYSTLATMSVTESTWGFGTASTSNGITLKAPNNTNLKWESTTQWDAGVDFTLFDQVSFSLDYWHKTTNGLLTERQYPSYAGGGSSYINLGQMINQGFDASITYTPFKKTNFYWTMTWNGSYLNNKVADLGEMGDKFYPADGQNYTAVQLEDSPFIVQKGQPLGQFYGFKWLGLWSTDQAEEAAKYGQSPGDNRYEDVNGDGKIDNDDKMVIGNYMPKFTWSYNTTINWKDFDFNLLIDGAHGMDMMNFNKMEAGVLVGTAKTITLREAAENYWTPERQNTMWAANSATRTELANSSKWVENAGYVKIRNISIGYTLPARIMKGHELRFNVSVQNVFTFTKYSGLDPEASVNDNQTTDVFGGIEYGVYPQARTFTGGITYKF